MLPAMVVTALFVAVAYRPAPPKEKIEWLSMSEAQEKFAKEKRPILVDLYTDWCGWCKRLDATTYKDPEVVAARFLSLEKDILPPMVNIFPRRVSTLNRVLRRLKSFFLIIPC